MAEATTENRHKEPQPADKLYMENTLLRVAGALFCHDAKRAPTRTLEIDLNRGVAEKKVVVRPDPRLGQPGPLAHKIFVALIKKHSSYGRPVPAEVSFTKRELMRLIGRTAWGGRDGDQLARALAEIHHASVRTTFKTREGRLVEHSFSIFPEIYLERSEHVSDPIETCTVTLARPIIESLRDNHFTCLNHRLMQELGTVGQALYMRLFFHFANHYQGQHRERLSFLKRYDDICAEWLGGLTVLKHRSMIERDQLGPHLRELLRVGFLASYTIRPASARDGFVITFRPGQEFVRDYDRFYRNRQQGELQYDFHGDRRDVAEPLKVAHLFAQRRAGLPVDSVPWVSSKDVATAREFLKQVPFEEASKFIDYALSEAAKTRFDVRTLGGLRQYLAGYRADRDHRLEANRAREEREQETNERIAYDRFRAAEADKLFASLSPDEQAQIDRLVRSQPSRFGQGRGALAETFYKIERTRLVADRFRDVIPTLENWKGRHQAL